MLSGGQGGSFGHLEFLVCEAVQTSTLHISDERCQCLRPGSRSRFGASAGLFGRAQKHTLAYIGRLIRRSAFPNTLFYTSVDHPHPEPFE